LKKLEVLARILTSQEETPPSPHKHFTFTVAYLLQGLVNSSAVTIRAAPR
jgi:hypothetical protein